MKKILVVLLVLAVATGVFAQGNWSIWGSAEIGARINLDVDTDNDEKATVEGVAYNGWDDIHGKFAINYGTDSGFNSGIEWEAYAGRDAGGVAYFNYSGETFEFAVGTNLAFFLSGLGGTFLDFSGVDLGDENEDITQSSLYWITDLWGKYNMLNGLVEMYVAYNSGDWNFWESDTTGMFSSDIIIKPRSWWANIDDFYGKPGAWASPDGWNIFVTNVNLDNLSFGVLVPNVFQVFDRESDDPRPEFVDDVLKKTIFGLKFNMSPVEFATQVKLEDYGVYFGGKFFTGPITAGLSFSGLLNPREDINKVIKFGGDIDFQGGAFGAGLAASLERWTDANDSANYDQLIQILPRFFYNAIPSHMAILLDAGFSFLNMAKGDAKESDMTWAVTPQVWWNFLGTGAMNEYWHQANGWSGRFTGMIFRYTVASESDVWSWGNVDYLPVGGWESWNALDLIFKWSF